MKHEEQVAGQDNPIQRDTPGGYLNSGYHSAGAPILHSPQPQTSQNHHAIQQNYDPVYSQRMTYYRTEHSTQQPAAMAATAAASGQGGYPYNPRDCVAVKEEPESQSPQQINNQIESCGPIAQQATRPVVTSSQLLINLGPHDSTAQFNHTSTSQQHPQSSELVSGASEESPLYVNAKQFHRILKRRVARQRIEDALNLTSKGRKPYLHESRHNHAMRRPRGPGGRFLTADEVAEIERTKGDSKEKGNKPQEIPAKNIPSGAGGSGTKRKADTGISTSDKKAKRKIASTNGRGSAKFKEDEDYEDDDD